MYIYNIHFLSFLSHSLCDVWTTHIERETKVLLMMDSIYRETETLSIIRLQEGIILLLSRWYALQMAIKNQWGGCDSLQKSHQLASHLFSWLSKSNGNCLVVQFSRFHFFIYFIDSSFIMSHLFFLCFM